VVIGGGGGLRQIKLLPHSPFTGKFFIFGIDLYDFSLIFLRVALKAVMQFHTFKVKPAHGALFI
jgi:hypothetical protein